MALFRVLPRLCCFPRLYDCSGAGTAPLFLASLEKRVLQGKSRPLCRTLAVYCRNGSLFEHTTTITLPQCSYLSTKAQKKKPQNTRKDHEHGSVLNELMSVKEDAQPTQLTVGAKVLQAGKDFSYLLVVLGGFAVAGFLLWSVGSEFFSSNSPQTLYSKALKRVRQDMQVKDALGEPISGHGELRGRGRRREPLHQEYVVDGVTYMRMKFYVKGSLRSGTVQLDMKKNAQGKYELRFLFVELDGGPRRTIVVEDNR